MNQNYQIQHFIPVLLSKIEFTCILKNWGFSHMAYCFLRSTKTKCCEFS